jgi:hypothetical protein
MIAFNREERTGDDAFVHDFDGDALGAEHVRSVAQERSDNLPRDCHVSISNEKECRTQEYSCRPPGRGSQQIFNMQ